MLIVAPTVEGAMLHHFKCYRDNFPNFKYCSSSSDVVDVDIEIKKPRSKLLRMFNVNNVSRILHFSSENKINKILCVNGEYLFWVALLGLICRLKGFVFIVTWHDYSPHSGRFVDRVLWGMSFISVAVASKVIFHNPIYYSRWNESPLRYLCKAEYVPFPVFSLSEPDGVELISDVHIEGKYFLYFGQVAPYKGLDRLERFFTNNLGIKFVVVGRGDETILNQLNREGCTIIRRFISDDEVAYLVTRSLAVVMPYRHGTQSNTPNIAASLGAALIVSEDVDFLYSVLEVGGSVVDFDTVSLEELIDLSDIKTKSDALSNYYFVDAISSI